MTCSFPPATRFQVVHGAWRHTSGRSGNSDFRPYNAIAALLMGIKRAFLIDNPEAVFSQRLEVAVPSGLPFV